MIVGECKYSNKKVGIDILKSLKEKALNIELKLPINRYFLFSKSGFTKELLHLSQSDNSIELVEKLI